MAMLIDYYNLLCIKIFVCVIEAFLPQKYHCHDQDSPAEFCNLQPEVLVYYFDEEYRE